MYGCEPEFIRAVTGGNKRVDDLIAIGMEVELTEPLSYTLRKEAGGETIVMAAGESGNIISEERRDDGRWYLIDFEYVMWWVHFNRLCVPG